MSSVYICVCGGFYRIFTDRIFYCCSIYVYIFYKYARYFCTIIIITPKIAFGSNLLSVTHSFFSFAPCFSFGFFSFSNFCFVFFLFCCLLLHQTEREKGSHSIFFLRVFFFLLVVFRFICVAMANVVVQHAIRFLCIHSNTDIHFIFFSMVTGPLFCKHFALLFLLYSSLCVTQFTLNPILSMLFVG